MLLSDIKIKSAKVPETKKQLKLTDGGGLYLLVKPSGKYWRLDYRFANKRKTMAIGVYPRVTLKEAREAREAAKKLLEKNIDPVQSKKADKRLAMTQANEATFKSVANEWLNKQSEHWAKTTFVNTKSKLTTDCGPVGLKKAYQLRVGRLFLLEFKRLVTSSASCSILYFTALHIRFTPFFGIPSTSKSLFHTIL